MKSIYKNILITGASSGIGKGLAVFYARNGAETLFISGRNKTRLEEVEKECKNFCKNTFAFQLDVTDKEGMSKWIKDCDKKAPLDLVFANAGMGTCDDSLEATYQTFDVNINGVLNTVLPTIEAYREQNIQDSEFDFRENNGSKTRSGKAECTKEVHEHLSNGFYNQNSSKIKSIAIVSSIAGYHGLATCPDYSATKACVKAWGEALRVKLKNEKINVSIICPGFVKSNITAQNTCAMPGILEIDEAAEKIADGLNKKRGIISFPWYLRFTTWLISILPNCISDFIYSILPQKA